jgi:hypothetical protein
MYAQKPSTTQVGHLFPFFLRHKKNTLPVIVTKIGNPTVIDNMMIHQIVPAVEGSILFAFRFQFSQTDRIGLKVSEIPYSRPSPKITQ